MHFATKTHWVTFIPPSYGALDWAGPFLPDLLLNTLIRGRHLFKRSFTTVLWCTLLWPGGVWWWGRNVLPNLNLSVALLLDFFCSVVPSSGGVLGTSGRRPQVDREHAGGILYPIWLGNPSGSLRRTWKTLLGGEPSGLACLACCHRDPALYKQQKMTKWMVYSKGHSKETMPTMFFWSCKKI